MGYTGDDSEAIDKLNEIDSRCIVKFRPADDWEGKYGFDWFREGDYGELLCNGKREDGDYNFTLYHGRIREYKNELGQPTTYFAKAKTDFHDDLIISTDSDLYAKNNYFSVKIRTPFIHQTLTTFKNLYEGVKTNHESNYYVPSISLFYQNESKTDMDWGEYTADIKLLIHAENIIAIEFIIDEGAKGVELNRYAFIGDMNGDSIEKQLKITLTKEFTKNVGEVSIRAIATHKNTFFFQSKLTKTLAGKIKIVRCEPKYIDIVIVNISVQLSQRVNIISYDIDGEKKQIKEFLSQAHIIPRFLPGQMSDQSANEIIKDYINPSFPTYIDLLKNGQDDIVARLLEAFNKERQNKDKIGMIKLFFLNVEDVKYLGKSIIGGNAAVILPDMDYPNTACHELTHCLGLYHTFSNHSPVVFKKNVTSNVMDYQIPTGLKLLTFWRWQWKKMRDGVDKHNEPSQNNV